MLLGIVLFFVISFFVVNFLNNAFSGERPDDVKRQASLGQTSPSFSQKTETKPSFNEVASSQPNYAPYFSSQPASDNQSIVKTIQTLLKNSTPEEEVISNLRDLGLDEKSAKKMILIAQSDAIEIFKDEIDKITKRNVEEQISKIQSAISAANYTPPEKKAQQIKSNLDNQLEKAQFNTLKTKDEMARGLVKLADQLEEIKLPDLERPKSDQKKNLSA